MMSRLASRMADRWWVIFLAVFRGASFQPRFSLVLRGAGKEICYSMHEKNPGLDKWCFNKKLNAADRHELAPLPA